ncbi:MAG: CrcB family protein [Bacteroidetes bacterium]|nr:MAG: CrcB family protein [Bacteroidota bacterium]
MIQYLALIFLGGGLGSVSRFAVSELALRFFQSKIPLGTLLSNLTASVILISIVAAFNNEFDESAWIKPFLLIGFCGGFSTFSTFSFETYLLFKTGLVTYGVLNIIFNLLFCIGIMFVIYKNI